MNSKRIAEELVSVAKRLSGNESEIEQVTQEFARFLIGDRKTALTRLNGLKGSQIYADWLADVMTQDDMSEYNKTFSELTGKLKKAIKSSIG